MSYVKKLDRPLYIIQFNRDELINDVKKYIKINC